MKSGITIGIDLGDKNHEVCVLNGGGNVVEQKTIPSSPGAMGGFFDRYAGAVVAMETGTHSGWVSKSVSRIEAAPSGEDRGRPQVPPQLKKLIHLNHFFRDVSGM